MTSLSELFIDRMSAMTGFLGARGISIGTNLSSKGEFHSWTLPLAKSTNVFQPITYIPADEEVGGKGTRHFLENSHKAVVRY